MERRGVLGDGPTVRQPYPERGQAGFELQVVAGPDWGSYVTAEVLKPAPLLIGTSPACDLRLGDPQVSRRHAAVEIRDGLLRLKDLGTTNGTYMKGVRIFEVGLIGGERVRLGETELEVRRSTVAAESPVPEAQSFGRVLGQSAAMRRLFPLCERLAKSELPLVIEGETGTGKELLAEAIHEASPRARKPFVVFDCTAVPPNLLEAALFGHERGAFTGATERRPGVFEEAHGGTLLVDEIGELDLALQPKLLRAIERGEVRRVGGSAWIRADVRVIAATRRDLDREVQAGRFRDDLFFRVAVARIELPALRTRQGDVPLLAQCFWSQLGGVGPLPAEFLERHEGYDWPGNVRELQNAVARRIALGGATAETGLARAPASTRSSKAGPSVDALERILALDLPLPLARQRLVEEFEARYLERVLERHGGHVARAAEASGIAKRYFQQLRARAAR
jgi:two-component system response regulator HydG